MKAIMLSIKPKYVAKILNNEKTKEIRKRFPKDYRGWIYIYCTKEKKFNLGSFRHDSLNGKVVARFWCDKVDDYVNGRKWSWKSGCLMWGACNDYEYILKDCCLTDDELRNYADDLAFSAIHISKLENFDTPKEISEFMKASCKGCPFENTQTCHNDTTGKYCKLTKAPQSYCYIEVEE